MKTHLVRNLVQTKGRWIRETGNEQIYIFYLVPLKSTSFRVVWLYVSHGKHIRCSDYHTAINRIKHGAMPEIGC